MKSSLLSLCYDIIFLYEVSLLPVCYVINFLYTKLVYYLFVMTYVFSLLPVFYDNVSL